MYEKSIDGCEKVQEMRLREMELNRGMIGTASTPVQLQVHEALSISDSTAERLLKRCAELRSRLEPVMRPTGTTEEYRNKREQPFSATIAVSIDGITQRIEEAECLLMDIFDRLEV